MIKKNNYLNILIWTILVTVPFLLQDAGIITTADWLIKPGNGLTSIITGSFLHGSYAHFIGNLIGLLMGVSILYNFYHKMYWQVIVLGIILPSGYMYMLGNPCLGISGLVYTLIWFVLMRGLMSRDYVRFLIGFAVLIFYGASVKGAIPQDAFSRIAWQAHLIGLLTGFSLAIYQRLRRIN